MSGRSERRSSKKSDGESGLAFGWRAISCAQPPRTRRAAKAPASANPRRRAWRRTLLIEHLGQIVRLQTLQELRSLHAIELRIARFDAEEKAVVRRQGEARSIEHRMMWLRQLVQRQHAEHGEGRRAEHGQFKGDWNERRPTVHREIGRASCRERV